jgi:hypothetical protein
MRLASFTITQFHVGQTPHQQFCPVNSQRFASMHSLLAGQLLA